MPFSPTIPEPEIRMTDPSTEGNGCRRHPPRCLLVCHSKIPKSVCLLGLAGGDQSSRRRVIARSEVMEWPAVFQKRDCHVFSDLRVFRADRFQSSSAFHGQSDRRASTSQPTGRRPQAPHETSSECLEWTRQFELRSLRNQMLRGLPPVWRFRLLSRFSKRTLMLKW